MFRLKPTPLQIAAFGGGATLAGIRAYSRRSDSQDELNTSTFTPFTLVKKEPVSSTSSIFTLAPKQPSKDNAVLRDIWQKGVWSIQIKQPQLQIARAYTPLPTTTTAGTGEDDDGKGTQLRLLIRKEQNGEVSNYLHNIASGGTVEVRGPTVEYELPADTKEVVFLAGGTGIAPALQIAHTLRGRGARMSILWATRKREDCAGGQSDNVASAVSGGWFAGLGRFVLSMPPTGENNPEVRDIEARNAVVRQLEMMKDGYGKSAGAGLQVDYFVDEEGSFISKDSIKSLTSSKPSAVFGQEADSRLIIVSGPEGFVNHWAGPKQWYNGREVQGPLGGQLGQLQLKEWKVIKL